MSFMQRMLGALRPATPAQAVSIKDVRAAILAEGDDPAALERLLASGRCDLDSGGEGVRPVTSMNRMVMTSDDTFATILAAMLGKPRRLRVLLDHGAGLQVRCGSGRTALHWAVLGKEEAKNIGFGHHVAAGPELQAGLLVCARLLLERGADVNAVDSLDFTPLHRACMVPGKLEFVRLLLAQGARSDATCNPDREPPLHLAVRCGADEAAVALLEAGAAVNAADLQSRAALHWACAKGKAELVQGLLQRGADPQLPDAEGNSPTNLALQSGSLATFRLVQQAVQAALPRGAAAPPLPEHWQVLLLLGALRRKDEASLQALTQALDINARDQRGVVWWHYVASNEPAPEATAWLLDHGAALEVEGANGERGLHAAAHAGHAATVALLLARGAAPDVGNWRPLHRAAHQGHLPVVEHLIAAGADLRAVADHWKTPVSLAVAGKHRPVVERLLEAMAPSGGLRGLPGFSPLNMACETNDRELVEVLLRHQPDIDGPTQDGWTPLHAAIGHPGDEIARMLLAAGANPNAPSEAGYLPIHRAAAKGRPDLMRLLVQHGADPTRRDVGGAGLHEFAKSSSNPAALAAVAALLPAAPALNDAEYRRQTQATLAYHLARAPARLAMAQRQGLALIAPLAERNDAEHPFVVQWSGLATAVAAIYLHLDALFGPRILRPGADTAQATRGWVLQRVSHEKHPTRLLHRLEIFIPSRGTATVFYDLSAAAQPTQVLPGLLAHALLQPAD